MLSSLLAPRKTQRLAELLHCVLVINHEPRGENRTHVFQTGERHVEGFFGIFSGTNSPERGASIVSGGTFPTSLAAHIQSYPQILLQGLVLFPLPVNPFPPNWAFCCLCCAPSTQSLLQPQLPSIFLQPLITIPTICHVKGRCSLFSRY